MCPMRSVFELFNKLISALDETVDSHTEGYEGILSLRSAFELFDELLSALDETVDSFGMYKYQHVNDTYLVSCPRGALPDIDETQEPYPGDYTIQMALLASRIKKVEMALLAFRIKEVVETFYTHAGERLSIQAGLNSGPAAGAVVGRQFDHSSYGRDSGDFISGDN
ncbi:hypothetical protein T484DRAFT_1782854 [Baffinella frigidus]|nr:hypothetical protein T484DRAFT_1782854 [Cryptophyta sp. CCMP2293]